MAKEIYFRAVPDRRLGAPNYLKPWTPPANFPRARFYLQLKKAHPQLDDLDAAFLIEETIYFFDSVPLPEPRRSESLLKKVQMEIDFYCGRTWTTTTLTDWARHPIGTEMDRSTAREPSTFENDRWLLQRIADELRQEA